MDKLTNLNKKATTKKKNSNQNKKTKIQPVQFTTQTVAICFAWKQPPSCSMKEKEFSVSHISHFTPKNIKYERVKI